MSRLVASSRTTSVVPGLDGLARRRRRGGGAAVAGLWRVAPHRQMRACRAEGKRLDARDGRRLAGRELEQTERLVQRLLVLAQLRFLFLRKADQVGQPARVVGERRLLAEGERSSECRRRSAARAARSGGCERVMP